MTIMHNAIPSAVLSVCQHLHEGGHAAFVVGGAVRDLLMGRTPHDFDVATSALPDVALRIFPHTVATGMKHGTMTVMCISGPIEVTTFRGEGAYTDGRHPDSVRFVSTVEEDLARRDFTVNAMALDPVTLKVVDPFGGKADITSRTLRCVGRPVDRFSEDGLRVMRAIRFATTLGFMIDGLTRSAITAAIPTFRKVAVERVRDELVKMLAAAEPSRGLRLMLETGLLAEVLPEMLPQVGMEQNRHHTLDVFEHSLAVVDAAAPSIRLAALLHDIGKPTTREPHPQWQGEFAFHGHDAMGADMATVIMERLKFSNDEIAIVTGLVRHHMLFVRNRSWNGPGVRRFVRKVGRENLDALFALRAADIAGGKNAPEAVAELEELRTKVAVELERKAPLEVRELAIGGDEVMAMLGWKPGKLVGAVLKRLMEHVLEDPRLNTVEALKVLVPFVAEEVSACST